MSFHPYIESNNACWHCVAFDGMTAEDTAALCTMPRHPRVRSQPEGGCSSFVRETGCDDEQARQVVVQVPKQLTSRD